MKLLILSIMMFVSTAVPSSADKPWASDYIQDIARKSPKIRTAWQWIVPRAYRDQAWLTDITQATSGPVERMLIDGHRFILGYGCWPHNCGENQVIFLIAADGSQAYGLLSSRDLNAPEVYFGHPPTDKAALLRETMKTQMQQGDRYYGIYAK